MVSHRAFESVALAGVLAGFVLFGLGTAPVLAGVVTAGSAYALVVSESFTSGRALEPPASGSVER